MRNYERDLPQRDERHALRQHLGEFHCSLCADAVPIEAASSKVKQLATQCRCMCLPMCRSSMSHMGSSYYSTHLREVRLGIFTIASEIILVPSALRPLPAKLPSNKVAQVRQPRDHT